MSNSSTSSPLPGAADAHPADGTPYPPPFAALGLVPSVLPDIPVCAVLLVLFLVAAAANTAIFRRNLARGHRFFFSALLAAFCGARALALAMRCAWAVRPQSVRVALATQIVTAAGVVILLLTNLVFAQRLVTAYHPVFGWRRSVTGIFAGLFVSAGVVLAAVVTATVHGVIVTDGSEAKVVDRTVQLVCGTYLAMCASLPVVLCALAVLVPGKDKVDRFGEGRLRSKVALVSFTASLLAFGAGFRAAVAYDTRPLSEPAWFHSKVCYYCFNFGLELVVVVTYAAFRFDKRFYIPDGSSGPGQYSGSWPASWGAGGQAASAGLFGRLRRNKRNDDAGDGAVELADLPSPPSPVARTQIGQSTASSVYSTAGAARSASSVYGTPPSDSSLVSDGDGQSVTQAIQGPSGDDEEAQRLEDAQESGPLPRIRISRSGDLVRGLRNSISLETSAWLRGLEPSASQPGNENRSGEEGGSSDDTGRRTDEEGSQSDTDEGNLADDEGSSRRSGGSISEAATPSPSEWSS